MINLLRLPNYYLEILSLAPRQLFKAGTTAIQFSPTFIDLYYNSRNFYYLVVFREGALVTAQL